MLVFFVVVADAADQGDAENTEGRTVAIGTLRYSGGDTISHAVGGNFLVPGSVGRASRWRALPDELRVTLMLVTPSMLELPSGPGSDEVRGSRAIDRRGPLRF